MSHQHNFYDSPYSMNKQINQLELAKKTNPEFGRLVRACHANISHALTFYGSQRANEATRTRIDK